MISRPHQATLCRRKRQRQPVLSSHPWTLTKETKLSFGKQGCRRGRLSAPSHKMMNLIARSTISKQSTNKRSARRRCSTSLSCRRRLMKRLKRCVTSNHMRIGTITKTFVTRVATTTTFVRRHTNSKTSCMTKLPRSHQNYKPHLDHHYTDYTCYITIFFKKIHLLVNPANQTLCPLSLARRIQQNNHIWLHQTNTIQ